MAGRAVATPITEAEFQAQLIQLAHILGWRHNHTRRSIGKGRKWTTATSCVGFPDLTLWHTAQQRVIFAELKTDKGKASIEQVEVLDSLRRAGAEVFLWRPSQLEEIKQILTANLVILTE